MIGWTNTADSGTNIQNVKAVIHVTAPVGSTISFSKGDIVAKVLGPEKSHVNAEDNTLADWYYAVAPSNYGTWTITATRGLDTASKTVTVDSNKQYDLELPYSLWLVKDGIALVEPQLIHLEVVPNRYYMLKQPGGVPCPIVAWQINTTVEFSTVTFEFWSEKMEGSTGRCGISGSVVQLNDINAVNATYIASTAIPPIPSNSLFTRTVDISNMVTNGKYIQCTRDWSSGGNVAYELKSVYLTPASEVAP